MARFEGSTAVVTGAATGIGRAIALALVADGAKVVAVDIDEENLAQLATERLETLTADVGELPPEALAKRVADVFGPPDLIVNNVGVNAERSFLELTPEVFERTWRANVLGPLFQTQYWVKELIARSQPGAVVFMTSLHDQFIRFNPDYSSTKAALRLLVRELADELGPHGIRVNALAPGAIDVTADPPATNVADGLIALRRVGRPSDVAPLALALLDDSISGYVTGTTVYVDGGLAGYNWLHHLYGAASEERRVIHSDDG